MGLLFGNGSIWQSITQPSKWWDYFKNGETNDVNKQINSENLAFQRENLDYQKALQKQIFEREDTAYQRTVSDMRAAGLNPVSMQGTNGAGEAIATEPLQNNYQHSDTGNLAAISQIFDVINQISNTRNNASLQQSQANLINAQAENQKIKNLYENDLLSKTIDSLDLQNVGKKFENERSNIAWLNDQANLNFNTMYGLTDNMPDIVKMAGLMSNQKIYNREFVDIGKKIKDTGFGKAGTYYSSPNESYFLSGQQLQGAIMENNILNGLLALIPGIGKLLGK